MLSGYIAPHNPIVQAVTAIWAEVLDVKAVGLHDNFFELGGHSLLATQVISRIRQTFNVELPLRTLFERPTVTGLSLGVEAALQLKQDLPALPLQPVAREGELALSFAQQRLWFLDQLEPGSPLYNIPAAIRLGGPLAIAALEWSLNQAIHRHEVLRTTFRAVAGRPVQVIAPTLTLTLAVVDLRTLSTAERERQVRQLAVEEATCPFDLEQGPLLRAKLLQLGAEEFVLLLTMHHIISDGWSIGILIDEMTSFYQAFVTHTAVALPDLPIQYADFAA